jgi:hypothetical protein
MKSDPLINACAGVENHPISRTDEPAVRFHEVVKLTGVKSLTFDPSVMLARVAVEAFGVTVRVASFVAVNATVATFEVRPTCASAVLVVVKSKAAAPVSAFLRRECIAGLRAQVVSFLYLRSTRAMPAARVREKAQGFDSGSGVGGWPERNGSGGHWRLARNKVGLKHGRVSGRSLAGYATVAAWII